MTGAACSIGELRNIGPTIAARLEDVGVRTRGDLARVGAAAAYRKIRRRNPNVSIPVCYYLYSLEGALRDRHWDDLPESVKRRLRSEAGID